MKPLASAFKGKCQKRYRHKKDFTFYDENGIPIATFKIDGKLSDAELRKELSEYKELSGGVTCFLTWTAQKGKCMEEVQI